MSTAAAPAPAPPDPTPLAAQDALEDAQHRRVLALLIDLGAALAQEIAQSPSEPQPAAARAEAFERVSRATRRTVLVARHVAQQIAQRPTEAPTPAQRRTAARARLIREVEDNIQAKARPADAGALRAELIDRLDSPDLEADLLSRPVADLIAQFLRDLGLAHPPGDHRPTHPVGRRTPADIARLNLLAALPPGQAAALAATFPPPKPPPEPSRPPPPPKESWRNQPAPDPAIRPDSLLATLLKQAQ